MRNFAITGVAGYIAPEHLRAIRDTGNRLVAAVDPHDSVGILDAFWPDAAFFVELERFDRHLERLRRGPDSERVHVVTICSPNHLHDAHIRLALRAGADALCEKPLVINPWNLDALRFLEEETGRRVYTVLQLRWHPAMLALRERLRTDAPRRHRVVVTYVTTRGAWYRYSWKGQPEKSGGVVVNVGVHVFDLLIWLFGPLRRSLVHLAGSARYAGMLELANADVAWYLSLDPADLPFAPVPGTRQAYRSIAVDGAGVDISARAPDLHTRVYEATLSGAGLGLGEAAPAIELCHAIRTAAPVAPDAGAHPYVLTADRRPLT